MKKILLLLSLLTCSVFSMQLVTIKQRAQIVHEKLVRHYLPKETKEISPVDSSRQKTDKKPVNDLKDLINSSSVVSSQSLGEVKLFHNEEGFHVLHNNEIHHVQPAFTDLIVRKATTLQMKDFQKADKGYLHVTQMANRQFEIKVMDRLPGGGVGGAVIGFYAGRFITYFVGHGAIIAVSFLSGPLAPATFAGLEACFAPHIELTAQAASLAGGILGAVITGPV